MAIYVETSKFEREHGKAPKGYGGWGFTLTGGKAPDSEVWMSGTYTDARKEAQRQAKERGNTIVIVLP